MIRGLDADPGVRPDLGWSVAGRIDELVEQGTRLGVELSTSPRPGAASSAGP